MSLETGLVPKFLRFGLQPCSQGHLLNSCFNTYIFKFRLEWFLNKLVRKFHHRAIPQMYHISLFSLLTILLFCLLGFGLSNQVVGAEEITPLSLAATGVPISVAPILLFPLFPRWSSYYAFNTVPGQESWFKWITFGFDGRSFMVGGQGVTREGMNTGNSQRAWQGYSFVRYFANFNPYGASIAVNYDVQLWGPNLPKTPRTLQGNESITLLFSFSSDGKIFAAGHYDLFLAGEVKTNKEERSLQGQTSIAGVVVFNPYGRSFAKGYYDQTLAGNIKSAQEECTLQEQISATGIAVFNPYGRSFAKGYGDFTVAGNIRSTNEERTLQGQESLGMLIGFNPAGRYAVATSYDDLQLAGMVSNNEEQRSLQVQQSSGLTMASHRDKEALTSSFSDLQMAGFRDNGKEQRSLQGRESSGVTRVYHPDQSLFTSGLYDLELKGLVRNDIVRRALQGDDNLNWSVAVSPYAPPVALVNWEKYLQQW